DLLERLANLALGPGPDEARDLPAVAQKHQRRPKLHIEGTAQRTATAIRNFDMAHARMIGESRGQQRLGGATVSAPRAAKLDHGGTIEHVDRRARWLGRRIHIVHRHTIPAGVMSSSASGALTPRWYQ